jgi:hypothetical protein
VISSQRIPEQYAATAVSNQSRVVMRVLLHARVHEVLTIVQSATSGHIAKKSTEEVVEYCVL